MSEVSSGPARRHRALQLVACAGCVVLFLAGCASPPTVQQEKEQARQIEIEARKQYDVFRDRVVSQYIDEIGETIVAAAGPQALDYSFTVIEQEDPNAFAIAGGSIFVTTGLILAARNVGEIAGAVGHEIGHVHHRHVADKIARAKNAGLLRTAAVVAAGVFGGRGGAYAADQLSGLSAVAYINNFTREDENEADAFAVRVMPAAGYDPEGLVGMLDTLGRLSGIKRTNWLSSHPAPPDRVAATRVQIDAMNLPPGLVMEDGGRFEIIQHRIRLLTGATDDRDTARP